MKDIFERAPRWAGERFGEVTEPIYHVDVTGSGLLVVTASQRLRDEYEPDGDLFVKRVPYSGLSEEAESRLYGMFSKGPRHFAPGTTTVRNAEGDVERREKHKWMEFERDFFGMTDLPAFVGLCTAAYLKTAMELRKGKTNGWSNKAVEFLDGYPMDSTCVHELLHGKSCWVHDLLPVYKFGLDIESADELFSLGGEYMYNREFHPEFLPRFLEYIRHRAEDFGIPIKDGRPVLSAHTGGSMLLHAILKDPKALEFMENVFAPKK